MRAHTRSLRISRGAYFLPDQERHTSTGPAGTSCRLCAISSSWRAGFRSNAGGRTGTSSNTRGASFSSRLDPPSRRNNRVQRCATTCVWAMHTGRGELHATQPVQPSTHELRQGECARPTSSAHPRASPPGNAPVRSEQPHPAGLLRPGANLHCRSRHAS